VKDAAGRMTIVDDDSEETKVGLIKGCIWVKDTGLKMPMMSLDSRVKMRNQKMRYNHNKELDDEC